MRRKKQNSALASEINTATAALLTELKGIGPAYSNRIVNTGIGWGDLELRATAGGIRLGRFSIQ